jgi:hypothetical protein
LSKTTPVTSSENAPAVGRLSRLMFAPPVISLLLKLIEEGRTSYDCNHMGRLLPL